MNEIFKKEASNKKIPDNTRIQGRIKRELASAIPS
jgi:hypothetical protein